MNKKKFLSLMLTFLILMLSVGCSSKKGESTTIDLSSTEISSSETATAKSDNSAESTDTNISESASENSVETETEIVTETDAKGNVVTDSNGTAVTKTVTVTKNNNSSSNSNSKTNSSKTTTTNKNNSSKTTTTTKKNSSAQKTTTKATQKQENQVQQTTKAVQTTATPKATTATPVEVIETETEEDNGVFITLSDSGITADKTDGISINSSVVTITQDGKYTFTGTLSNGQIVVNAPKDAKINIHLNGVSITSSSSAPIYVMSADTCVIHMDDGSTNYVSDTSSNSLSACIFSKDDLTFKGNGTLTVVGNKKHAVKSSNDIKIKNGTLNLSSVSTALYGDDSVWMTGGNVIVSSCKDGIKSANEEDSTKGFVQIDGGYVDIQNASGNGIEAVTGITISGGAVNVHSAKKALKCDAQSINESCFCEY
jgi:hypothetical protein